MCGDAITAKSKVTSRSGRRLSTGERRSGSERALSQGDILQALFSSQVKGQTAKPFPVVFIYASQSLGWWSVLWKRDGSGECSISQPRWRWTEGLMKAQLFINVHSRSQAHPLHYFPQREVWGFHPTSLLFEGQVLVSLTGEVVRQWFLEKSYLITDGLYSHVHLDQKVVFFILMTGKEVSILTVLTNRNGQMSRGDI